jgi:hypothetical protein
MFPSILHPQQARALWQTSFNTQQTIRFEKTMHRACSSRWSFLWLARHHVLKLWLVLLAFHQTTTFLFPSLFQFFELQQELNR